MSHEAIKEKVFGPTLYEVRFNMYETVKFVNKNKIYEHLQFVVIGRLNLVKTRMYRYLYWKGLDL